MPIYEYRCKQCGEVSEILTGIGSHSDAPQCKHCGSKDLEKMLSLSPFSFADGNRVPGTTCCGREERCNSPPCTTGDICRRDRA